MSTRHLNKVNRHLNHVNTVTEVMSKGNNNNLGTASCLTLFKASSLAATDMIESLYEIMLGQFITGLMLNKLSIF